MSVPHPIPFDSLREQLASGEITCERITDEYLTIIEQKKHLNAFRSVFTDEARERSRLIDKKIATGTSGPLAGMVIAIKDVICMESSPTTCGSKILEHFVSPYNATVIKKLADADAIIIGKTNMDEFAMGSSTENSAYGVVLNPVDETRVPGGSSGGSAVAVAANCSRTALGTDTGGSVRQPAAFCGVVGLKPTYGRVSRYGLVAFASSFDQIGPFGQSVRDIAHVLQVIAGHDRHDSTSANVPVPDYLEHLTGDVRGLRIGLPKEYFADELNEEIRNAIHGKVEILKQRGAIVKEVSLPHTEYTVATYYILTTAEASSNLARYDGARFGYRSPNAKDLTTMYVHSRSEGFGAEVKRRIMLGTYVLSAGYYDAYYRKAQQVRRLIKQDFDNAFREVDCLITPTSPTTAFKIGEKVDDPLTMYLSDIYTVSANLAGVPCISIPCGTDLQGLPIGMQVFGRQFGEETILRIADSIEKG
ncbi:MAG: Asp-tRNA(Asn)/Glu-tRNA(Gln) amidotransferase subunit GatA [Bacteroidetes bacterium]|nr:MAG: Asp-tRNA(Asn)/Glu-tRNA(Gln) amidotransferase subunit GatA [Bacteroidota bacterium]